MHLSEDSFPIEQLPDLVFDMVIQALTAPLRANNPCNTYAFVARHWANYSLVNKRWRTTVQDFGPFAVRATSREQLDRLAESTAFPIAELEIDSRALGVQHSIEKLMDGKGFQKLSGPTLQRIAGLESSAIPAAYCERHARFFSCLQTLDGLWGVPRRGLPETISQLGLADTTHYVGYEMKSVGTAFQNLQRLEVLSLRGVVVDLQHLPPSLRLLLTCDCQIEGTRDSRLREQPQKAGRYSIFVSEGKGSGVVRLLMHYFSVLPGHWD